MLLGAHCLLALSLRAFHGSPSPGGSELEGGGAQVIGQIPISNL
jgi:hypothetical protein